MVVTIRSIMVRSALVLFRWWLWYLEPVWLARCSRLYCGTIFSCLMNELSGVWWLLWCNHECLVYHHCHHHCHHHHHCHCHQYQQCLARSGCDIVTYQTGGTSEASKLELAYSTHRSRPVVATAYQIVPPNHNNQPSSMLLQSYQRPLRDFHSTYHHQHLLVSHQTHTPNTHGYDMIVDILVAKLIGTNQSSGLDHAVLHQLAQRASRTNTRHLLNPPQNKSRKKHCKYQHRCNDQHLTVQVHDDHSQQRTRRLVSQALVAIVSKQLQQQQQQQQSKTKEANPYGLP
jgi:hypothetical protein